MPKTHYYFDPEIEKLVAGNLAHVFDEASARQHDLVKMFQDAHGFEVIPFMFLEQVFFLNSSFATKVSEGTLFPLSFHCASSGGDRVFNIRAESTLAKKMAAHDSLWSWGFTYEGILWPEVLKIAQEEMTEALNLLEEKSNIRIKFAIPQEGVRDIIDLIQAQIVDERKTFVQKNLNVDFERILVEGVDYKLVKSPLP